MKPVLTAVLFALIAVVATVILASRELRGTEPADGSVVPASTARDSRSRVDGSLQASAPGDSRSAVPQPTNAPEETVAELPAQTGKAITVQGHLRFLGVPSGNPEAEVSWTHSSGETRLFSSPAGPFRLTGLSAGSWRVRCRASGYRSLDRVIELAPGTIEKREDFELEAEFLIPVRFVDSAGQPWVPRRSAAGAPQVPHKALGAWFAPRADLPSVAVVATRTAPPLRLSQALFEELELLPGSEYVPQSAWLGRIAKERIPEGADGVVLLGTELPAYVSAVLHDHVLQTLPLDRGVAEIVFTIPPEALTKLRCGFFVRIVEARTRAPVPQAEVGIGAIWDGHGVLQRSLGRSPRRVGFFLSTKADADGVAHLQDLAPGRYRVTCSAPGRADVDVELELAAGETRDLGVLELARSLDVSGCLVDANGGPVSGWIRFTEVGRPDPSWRPVPEVRTDERGCFRQLLAAGQWVAEAGGGAEATGAGVFGGELGAPPIAIHLLDAPLEDLIVTLRPTTYVALTGSEDGTPAAFTISDSTTGVVIRSGHTDGSVVHVYLVPGRYVLAAMRPPGDPSGERAFVVGAEPLELTLPE